MSRSLLLVAILLHASAVRANGSTYTDLVTRAIAAQEAGDYPRARVLFAEAHSLDPSARTLRGMGVAAFQAGDAAQAVADLSAALEHPNKPLDDELRATVLLLIELAKETVGTYRVDVEPADAAVTVEGRTPARTASGALLLAPGWHTLHVSATGYLSQSIDLEARAKDEKGIKIALVKPDAEESVTAIVARSPKIVETPTKAVPLIMTPARSDERTPSPYIRPAMLASAAVGGALAMSAGTIALIGTVRANHIEADCGSGCSSDDVNRKVRDANLENLSHAATAVTVSAVVSLGTALALWLWNARTAHPVRTTAAKSRVDLSVRF